MSGKYSENAVESMGKELISPLSSGSTVRMTAPLFRWNRTHRAMSAAVELMLPAGPMTSTQCRALSSP